VPQAVIGMAVTRDGIPVPRHLHNPEGAERDAAVRARLVTQQVRNPGAPGAGIVSGVGKT
jgi:hypothetical protein